MNKFVKTAIGAFGVAMLMSLSAHAQSVQWEVADGGNGHIYEIVFAGPSGINWTAAQGDALSRGGYLATLTTAAENDFVFNNLVNNTSHWTLFNNAVYLGPWIGGFQPQGSQEPDGGWQWVNGEGLLADNYTNWRPNEPNNFSGRVENSLMFFNFATTPSNGWNDFRGNVSGPSYVVEYAVPEPTSRSLLVLGGVILIGRRRKQQSLGG